VLATTARASEWPPALYLTPRGLSLTTPGVIARKLALAAAAAVCALVASGHASADVGDRLGVLHRLRNDAQHAGGPAAYTALRRIWLQWDQGDPADVEETLAELASDEGVAAPARAYARLLEAYARRRRGDLEGAKTRIEALGYVERWMTVGPFDNEGKTGLLLPYGPEEDRQSAPSVLRAYDGKERTVRWRIAPSVSAFGWLDFGALIRPTEKVCGYSTTYVRDSHASNGVPARERPISLWVGSAGAFRVFWNGEEVLRDEAYRDLDADRLATTVKLAPGWNRLMVKVCGDEAAPMLSLRLAGPDGAPDEHLETEPNPLTAAEAATRSLVPYVSTAQPSHTTAEAGSRDVGPKPGSPAFAEAATSGHAKAALPKPPLSVGRVEGPVQAFDRLAASGDAAMLEAYARYLVVTQSDDPSQHKARELARKAAEKSPTIPRLLLAGELAEGRNQKAVWIDKAEALVDRGQGSGEERLDVVLARAGHTRRGLNRRDAIPYYDHALVLDPDNTEATLARFELYSAAGLHETALSFLSLALNRKPRSVALLRAMVAALRGEDRSAEADEIAQRYSEVRFDDPAFVRSRIELALARRDANETTRWVERLIATNPDSSAALAVAAHAFLSLGDRPRALATYRKSLDLAPEDTDTMRSLAEVYGIAGDRDEEVKLLKQVVALLPQSKDVREYLAQLTPSAPRADEAYARPASEFLKLRDLPANGYDRRTFVDLTATTVFPNGLASRFHQVVFQPLTESAAAEAREYAFGFEADSESVQLRGARVYRADGKIDEAIETGEGAADNPALSTYTSARAYYVHFPRLNPKDVVELLYRVEDVAQRNAFADYFGEVNYLQSSEPIARAEYVLLTPKSRTFYFNEPHVPNLTRTVDESGDLRTYRFVATDVPPVLPETAQPPYGELLGHVHVSTYKSWDEMARWYWGLVKDQFVADDEVRLRSAEATKGLTDERAKVRAVYDYVVEKTRYVALEFGIHGFKPYSCSQIFARGFGDCKDKATLIVTMLKELGIQATIVIVRTGLKGDFETYPASLAPFDHAIAYVPSLDLYLDGTAEYTGSTELPTMDRGALALQINEGQPKLVHLPDPPASESVTSRKVDVVETAEGGAQVDWRLSVSGAAAGSFRQRYHVASSRKERLAEDLGGELAGLTISQVEANDLDNIEEPVNLHVKARSQEIARREGETLSFPAGPHVHLVRDWATLSDRKLDLRLRAKATTVSDWTLHVPVGMRVVSAPPVADVKTPFGSVHVTAEVTGSSVHVVTTVTLDQTRIAAHDYQAFRAFCEAGDRALGQRLVVSK
jgi:tetratricopeptide (TPR) repeat protein